MPSVRPKGSAGGSRAPPAAPMSERQQMALVMQMTSSVNDSGSRSPGGANSRSRDRNERGETPLHLAAIKGDVEQVCKLLAHRADPNVTDFAGWTPLHEACNHGWYEVAFRLIQAGASVNAKGLDNQTPLHDAAVNGHVKVVKLLVERGADVNAKNMKGKTPLDVAPPGIVPYLTDTNLSNNESSTNSRLQARTRDEKKAVEASKQKTPTPSEESSMEASKSAAASAEDVYEFKASKEADSPPETGKNQDAVDANSETPDASTPPTVQPEETQKRNFSEVADATEDSGNDDETKRKKRKDETGKDVKTTAPQRAGNPVKGQTNKQATVAQTKSNLLNATKSASSDRRSPCPSPKASSGTSDPEVEDGKTDLKVPPLKIVIPQGSAGEQDAGAARNGKSNSQRAHQALPYVVASSNSDADKENGSGNQSPGESAKTDEKKEASAPPNVDEQRSSGHPHQRVLRSSHRPGPQSNLDRASNDSSPQLERSNSPSPSASPATPSNQSENSASSAGQSASCTAPKSHDGQPSVTSDAESSTSTSVSNSNTSTPAPVDLHPRKRKMKQNKDQSAPQQIHDAPEAPTVSEVHPHEQPITNCYQLYLNIRKQIEKRRKGLFPVQPKPPQGFKDYLMNRCTYVLAGTSPTTPNIITPTTLPPGMKDLYVDQEKERYKLRMQHVVEKEKLVLSVEQEILRVHGRAARALANQSLPFSVCTILRDEEVYNLITPEQEEKDRNARSRYNGRLFLSWLQDVDDKWEKIKESMLLRHHNEAESLHAVQKMDWEWKLKELSLCDAKSTPTIDEMHVPMVHVSDDFDLLPA